MNLDTCPHSREATVTGLTGGVEQTGATARHHPSQHRFNWKPDRDHSCTPAVPALAAPTGALVEHAQAILRVAVRLLGTQEFSATTVEDICTAAGIGRSTFYLYFESKEQLLMELAEATARGVADDVDSWVGTDRRRRHRRLCRRSRPPDGDRLARLAALVMRRVSAANVTARPLPGDPILFDDILTDIVREAQRRGEIRPGLQPREVGEVLAGMTLDALGRWAQRMARGRCESDSSSGSTPSSAASGPAGHARSESVSGRARASPVSGRPGTRRYGGGAVRGCGPVGSPSCRAEYSDGTITIMVTERMEGGPTGTGIETLSRRRASASCASAR